MKVKTKVQVLVSLDLILALLIYTACTYMMEMATTWWGALICIIISVGCGIAAFCLGLKIFRLGGNWS